jgi:putative heme-binding domain-containing protein
MLQPDDPRFLQALLGRIASESHPTADLHHLFAIARLPGMRTPEQTAAIASALLAIDAKLAERRLPLDSNWGERLGDLATALADRDGALPAALMHNPDFGRPGHVVLLKGFSAADRAAAAEAFLRAAEEQKDYAWTPEVVSLIGESSSPRSRERLRDLFEEPSLRGSVLIALSRDPMPRDREMFFTGLDEPNIEVVEHCITALEKLPPSADPREVAALVLALQRLDRDAREYAARSRVASLLEKGTGKQFGFVADKPGFKPQRESVSRWVEYLRGVAPDAIPAAGGDWESVQKTLAASESLAGDPQRGKKFYDAKSCGRCHDGGAVGPDLAGATGRFSREDLFLAIADPDREVSPRYRGTLIQTRDGKIVTGLVAYESVDGVTLKDGEKTWRVEADQIEFRKPLETSLMPRGLLKDATPQDLVDLAAYLATIGR